MSRVEIGYGSEAEEAAAKFKFPPEIKGDKSKQGLEVSVDHFETYAGDRDYEGELAEHMERIQTEAPVVYEALSKLSPDTINDLDSYMAAKGGILTQLIDGDQEQVLGVLKQLEDPDKSRREAAAELIKITD